MDKRDEIIMAANALQNFKTQLNPQHPSEDQIRELYREVEQIAHLAGTSINKLLQLHDSGK